MNLHILDIVAGTIVDGPGLRTSVYMGGCAHRCPGCHNPQSWNPSAGEEMSIDDILGVISREGLDVTLTGGDPFFHPRETAELARRIHAELRFGVWCYTGYTFEAIKNDETLSAALPYLDVLVDGPFLESLRDTDLRFRGSANQRLIDVSRSLSSGSAVEWSEDLSVF